MKTIYEFCIPRLRDDREWQRLRGLLDMRTGLALNHVDLSQRIVRVVGPSGRDRQLRELLNGIGYSPLPEDPAVGCQHRRAPNRYPQVRRRYAGAAASA